MIAGPVRRCNRCHLGENRGAGRIVFVSGNFNIVHPGHLRLLNFAAERGEFLVVGVIEDGASTPRNPGAASTRRRSVDQSWIMPSSCVCRRGIHFDAQTSDRGEGQKARALENPEREAVEEYGGRLLFSSGEVRFSSLDLLQKELLKRFFDDQEAGRLSAPAFVRNCDLVRRPQIHRRQGGCHWRSDRR
jgi:cytidyltransferase-like protein